MYACVCVCMSNRFSEILVLCAVFPSPFSPRALVLRPVREGLETRVCEAHCVTSAKRVFQRSRSEKRPGTVMLSTSSRSRHNLPILYVYTLFLSNAILSSFVTFRFVCMCFFFFSCVYLPLKVAGGCTARISLNDSVIFPLVCSHARRTCSRLSRDRPCQRRE